MVRFFRISELLFVSNIEFVNPKRKGIDTCTFVPTYEANERIPKMVIEFYESRVCVRKKLY